MQSPTSLLVAALAVIRLAATLSTSRATSAVLLSATAGDHGEIMPIATASVLPSMGSMDPPPYARPSQGCGPVTKYYGQVPSDWTKYDMDERLHRWLLIHINEIRVSPIGFAGVLGFWAVGGPDFSCANTGGRSTCDFDPCMMLPSVSAANQTREAYYWMQSTLNLHNYFADLADSYAIASMRVALDRTSYTELFYQGVAQMGPDVVRELVNNAGLAVALLACAAGITSIAPGTTAITTIFDAALAAVRPFIKTATDKLQLTLSPPGQQIAQVIFQGLTLYSDANDELMRGINFKGTGDVKAYFKNGTFLVPPNVDRSSIMNQTNVFLRGQFINALWRQQRIYIVGGGACDDNQGIGSGPREAFVCRDGKAWYLYFWNRPEEGGSKSTLREKFGFIGAPPGFDQFGAKTGLGINVQDVINSSLDSWKAAQYSYNTTFAVSRARNSLGKGLFNPLVKGPSSEGIFTIPVCDVGFIAAGSPFPFKQYILQPYGADARQRWCGGICGNETAPDARTTAQFLKAANMEGFDGPTRGCDPADPNL